MHARTRPPLSPTHKENTHAVTAKFIVSHGKSVGIVHHIIVVADPRLK